MTCDDEISVAPWVREAARLPIAFAQVREDAWVDEWVVRQLPERAAVLLVASGGCTAAVLASNPHLARLQLVDPNPAQMALARLKLRLLDIAGTTERQAILGHAPMPAAARAIVLANELHALDLSPDILGPLEWIARTGPDHAGRYEVLFAHLRAQLHEVQDELFRLLELRDPAEQARRVEASTRLGLALDGALDEVMSLPNLVHLFGERATANRCEPFARHFARRTRATLMTQPAADNPYLWQMYRGQFPEGILPPWLSRSAPAHRLEVGWSTTTMVEALPSFDEEFDFIHLSNILDWLSPDEARATLELTWKALHPGGWTLIRQLNSNLDIAAIGARFVWQRESATALHQRDRSFFYRALHLARKP